MTDPEQQMVDFAQGLVLQRFAEAKKSAGAFRAELFGKLDGLEARLVRIEQSLNGELKQMGLEMEVYYDKGSPKDAPLVTDLQIRKIRSGRILAHCSTLGEVRTFLQGYVACRRDFRDQVEEDDGP